ncbi:MAG TPA: LysR family transcriptional regulator [Polyangiales bacterium]|nr:LysR family transcriptional regulator [Polyangiales bacterium]
MTLDDLRTLIAVYECKSFSAAARRLGCTQPAVSQHIARLERELGLALFERQARGALVTQAGEQLVRAAADSLTGLERAINGLSELRDGGAGALSVTTGGTTVKHFMQGAIGRFRRAFPRVELQIRGAMSSAECLETLFREPVDLAFVTLGAELEGVREHPLLEIPYVWLTGRQASLARRSSLRVEELHGLEHIGLVEGRTSRGQLASSLARRGVVLDTTMTVCDWDTAINLVELGLGSAIVPSWHAHAAVKRAAVTAIPIQGLAPVRVGWALRDTHQLLKPAREFMRLLKQDLKERELPPGARLLRG